MATPTAKLDSGAPLFVDHTPGSAVTGGDVVVVGNVPMVAANDIAANELGALGAEGGVYRMPKTAGSGTAIGAGVKVYWDAGSKVVTTTAGGNKLFGYTTEASADADTEQRCVHAPDAA